MSDQPNVVIKQVAGDVIILSRLWNLQCQDFNELKISSREDAGNETGFILFVVWRMLHGKNDFAEGSKILLNTDLKIILLDHQNNFVETLKTMSIATKKVDILVWAFYIFILHFHEQEFKNSQIIIGHQNPLQYLLQDRHSDICICLSDICIW